VPERWTRTVLRFRFAFLALWLGLLILGLWSSTRLSPLLSNSFAVPGTDSARAQTILQRHFHERPDGVFTVVFRVRDTGASRPRAQARRRLILAARTVPTGRAGLLRSGSGVLYGDVATTLDLRHAKRHTEAVRASLRSTAGLPAYVTGQPAIQHDLDGVFRADLRRGEAIALPVALLVLLAVFGLCWAVAMPIVFAACTITATLAAVWGLAHVLSMVTYSTNLVELIGLGLAIDYSLLVVHRFREEVATPGSVDDAIVRTMATAGRAVAVAGTAVAIGLALLVFVPVPFIRSIGVAGFLIPLFSVAAALTLQPALLSILGRDGVRRVPMTAIAPAWLRRPRRQPGRAGVQPGLWARLAQAIMRRPLTVLALGVTALIAAAVPTVSLELTPASLTGIPGSLESARGLALLRDRVGPGAATPIQIVVDAGRAGGARTAREQAALDRLVDELTRDGEPYLIATGHSAPYVDRTGRYRRTIVVGRHEYAARETRRFVRRLRSELVPGARFPAGARVYAGGAPPQGEDFLARSYDAFPWLVLGSLALTFVVLMRAFRSLLLPVKALLLNVLSVAAAYGLLVVAFRWGVGADLFGLYRMRQLDGWIPIFLFTMLFGLSMDYEVFLVTRMRESWDRRHDNADAVAHGLQRTGGIVTAAALIMCAAFAGFVAGRVAALQEFGLGLALAVFVDATIVRALLVPASMAVLGRYNWWLPSRLGRLLRVEGSPPGPPGRARSGGGDAGAPPP
jgi:RND superfamily putative drug exporter